MTEYELVDSIATYNSIMQAWLTVLVTILSAYLIAAYMVGSRLSRSQAAILNTLYLGYSVLIVFAIVSAGSRCLEFVVEIQELNPAREFGLTPVILWVVLAVTSASVMVSLKFMWDIRHPKTE